MACSSGLIQPVCWSPGKAIMYSTGIICHNPYLPAEANAGNSSCSTDGSSQYQLRIELRSQDGGLADLHNVIGFHPLASVGRDGMDYFKPPPIGDLSAQPSRRMEKHSCGTSNPWMAEGSIGIWS